MLTNRKVSASKGSSTVKAVRAIRYGTDLMVFPEGVWNKSPNRLLLNLWPGVDRIACETGAKVIPVVHYIDDECLWEVCKKRGIEGDNTNCRMGAGTDRACQNGRMVLGNESEPKINAVKYLDILNMMEYTGGGSMYAYWNYYEAIGDIKKASEINGRIKSTPNNDVEHMGKLYLEEVEDDK